MKLHRFYCPDVTADEFTLDDIESNHLRILWLEKKGQEIEVFDGAGNHRVACVAFTPRGGKNIPLVAAGPIEKSPLPVPAVLLGVSLPKGDRQNTLIQMCQELGLYKLIPMICERSVSLRTKQAKGKWTELKKIGDAGKEIANVILDGKKIDNRKVGIFDVVQELNNTHCEKLVRIKLSRWERITISAAKQSGVNYLTEITAPLAFQRLIDSANEVSLPLIFTPHNAKPVVNVLQSKPNVTSILYLIGPEGDWSDKELKMAIDGGFIPVSMPLPVLRIETAAAAALTIIRSLACP